MRKVYFTLIAILIAAFTTLQYESTKPSTEVSQDKIAFISEKNNDILKSALSLLEQAKYSILVVNYVYNNPEILKVLNEKAKEGLDVTVVYERGQSRDWIAKLDPAIKKITRHIGEGYVHHKIIVVDSDFIWFSSTNFNNFQAKNITELFRSPEIAQAIKHEMDSIDGKIPRYQAQPVTDIIGGQKIELIFLPHKEPYEEGKPVESAMNEYGRKKLLDLINNAKSSIRASVVVFTYRDVANALVKAAKRGVKVEFIGSNIEANIRQTLENGHIPVKTVTVPYHHKWMLIDDKIFWNGSANWSLNAFSRTDDSVLILYDVTPEQLLFLEDVWQDLQNVSS